MVRKKTHEEFTLEVCNLVGDEYVILSKYITAKVKVKILHKQCGREYEMRPNDFLNGVRCPHCANKKTHGQYVEDVFLKYGGEFKILSKYDGSRKKVKVKHNICGSIYNIRSDKMGCPYCAVNTKLTMEEFVNRVNILYGSDYSVLDDYIGINEKLRVKHNICGSIFKITPSTFLRGIGICKECSNNYITTSNYSKLILDVGDGEYVLHSEYINSFTKVKVKHLKCGHVFDIVPKTLKLLKCPRCSFSLRCHDDFSYIVDKLGFGEYSIIEKYINSQTKIKVKHLKCGYVYAVTPSNFRTGSRCPRCSSSKGEYFIHKYLHDNDFKYVSQKTYIDLYNPQSNKKLLYDFHIPSLNLLIEYDGTQHDMPHAFGSNKSQTIKNQNMIDLNIRDNIKTQYAIDNNIFLIRINHVDFNNLEEIMDMVFFDA